MRRLKSNTVLGVLQTYSLEGLSEVTSVSEFDTREEAEVFIGRIQFPEITFYLWTGSKLLDSDLREAGVKFENTETGFKIWEPYEVYPESSLEEAPEEDLDETSKFMDLFKKAKIRKSAYIRMRDRRN